MSDVVWQRNVDYVGTQIDDLLVILDLAGGMYYSLNRPAADVWELLASPSAEPCLVDTLVKKYKVAPQDCAKSVQRLLEDFSGKGLVKTVD